MAFGGTFGPSGALLPFGIIFNILGEKGVGYDADGNIQFQRASGSVYTPARVDTLIVAGEIVQNTPPLGALQLGAANIANVDTGQLVTAAPLANEHGLPANFGPGRGNWADVTGRVTRLRIEASVQRNILALPAGQGAVEYVTDVAGSDVSALARNTSGEVVDTLRLVVECIHSVQG